jgi:hypothetical protein
VLERQNQNKNPMNEFDLNPNEPKLIKVKDNSNRAKILLSVFGVLIGLLLIGLLTGYNELQMLKNAQMGDYVSEQEANTSDMLQGVVGLSQLGLFLTSVIVFLNWFRRAYGNLHRAGVILKHQESMAVWAWIIPIVSFFRPVQIMNEIWMATQEKIKELDTSYTIKGGGIIIGLWWTLFLISNFVGRFLLTAAFKQETIEQLILSSEATLLSDIIQLLEAILVMLIVYKLSKMESKMAFEVNKSADNMGIIQ